VTLADLLYPITRIQQFTNTYLHSFTTLQQEVIDDSVEKLI